MTPRTDGTPKAIRAWIARGKVHVELEDRREAALPLDAFPRLAGAPASDVKQVEIWGGGSVLHWPALEEAIPVEAVVTGRVPAQPKASLELAATLKTLRKAAGLTQAELAQRLGCRQSLISMAENGRTCVSGNYLDRVEAACALPVPRKPAAPRPRRGPYQAKPSPTARSSKYPAAAGSSLARERLEPANKKKRPRPKA
jgi:HTH-type transcriptional regulator/antitoxin HipB